jgi:hypothetical protein
MIDWRLISRQMPRHLSVLISFFCCLAFVSEGRATEHNGLINWAGKGDFGGTGLFQTRTARSSADGLFEVGYSHIFPYKRYYLTLQGLPWLEGTFRYTDIENRLFSPFVSFSGTQTFKDRGADISIRLLEESKYSPALAVTFQDGLGTGQFSGEYLSATKRFYDLDVTLGITWGYAARSNRFKNPLAVLSSHFADRQGSIVTGGSLNVNDYFSGEFVAPYGGVAYRTPIDGLVFKFEYDPNDYQLEPQSNVLAFASNINYGFVYRPQSWFEASAAFERGNSYMVRFSLLSNLHDPGLPKSDPLPKKIKPRAEVEKDLMEYAGEEERPWWYLPVIEDIQNDLKEYLPKLTRIEKANEAAVAEMYEGFHREGLDIGAVETKEQNVQIVVSATNRDFDSRNYESIAKLVITAFPEQSEEITFLPDEAERGITISRKDLDDSIVVDHFFERMEAYGLSVGNLKLSHSSAEIFYTPLRGHAKASIQAAQLVLRSLPMPVKEITFILLTEGVEVDRTTYARDEIVRESIVDDLFSNLEQINVNLESIDIAGSILELTISEMGEGASAKYTEIALIVEDAVPLEISEIIVVQPLQPDKVSRVRIQRSVEANTSDEKWLTSGVSMVSEGAKTPQWSTDDREFIAERLFSALREFQISAEAIDLNGFRVTVYGSTRKYRQNARNIGRAMRVISNNIPSEIEELEFVTMSSGMEVSRAMIRREDLEKADVKESSIEEIWANGEISKPRSGIFFPETAVTAKHRYPSLDWTFKPKMRNQLGGPEQFLLYELYLTAGFDAALWRGLNITGRANRSLFDNFDKIKFGSSSVLPHVRSDIKEYLQESEKYSVSRVQANYYFSPMDEWYSRASVGIFEQMFGGYSAEVLHRPFDSRLAVGLEVNRVWKRGFEQRFKFQDYKVTTAHLSLYYEFPWYDIQGKVQIGQYLAGDRGATYTASRRFDSGISMGLWTTFTDVTAEEFGEGSFDKGFFIRIPFELFLTNSTRQAGTFAFRPITRDGGAILSVQGRLHGITSGGSRGEVMREWNRFLD